jgi:hypothetical protein
MQIKLTVRDVSIEYDGDEEFFKSSVPDILKKMAEVSGPTIALRPASGASAGNAGGGGESGGDIPKHSTNTIAKLTGATTGPDLIMAAVAKLVIIDENPTAKRDDITREMRAATSYYKKTYTNNLSKYLETLTKADQLRLVSEGNYGLPAKARESLEGKLRE